MKILFEALIGAAVIFGPALLVWTLQDPTYQIDCKNTTYPIAVDLSKLTIEKCKGK